MRKPLNVVVNRENYGSWFHVTIGGIPGEFHVVFTFVSHILGVDRRELNADGSYSLYGMLQVSTHDGGYKESMDRVVKYIIKEYYGKK